MYVVVRLLKGFPEPLLYAIPEVLVKKIHVGVIVDVPLKTQKKTAVVLALRDEKPAVSYDIREIVSVHEMPEDAQYQTFVEQLARIYFTQPLHFYQRLRSFLAHDAVEDDVFLKGDSSSHLAKAVALTAEQAGIVDEMVETIGVGVYAPALLHGVTGSGKTEVYKKLIVHTIAKEQTVLFLCPEVSLARQFEMIFRVQLSSEILVLGLHSASSKKDRERVWHAALSGAPCLIVGVHLPVLLPLKNLGLILIDEEHETGFEEKKYPQVNTKHAALIRARQYRIPILLGSATPSVSTLHVAEQQQWRRFSLTKRFSGSFPRIQHVLLSSKQKRPHFWLSKELVVALQDVLFRGQQAIVYLNRRGYSFFAQCSGCGHIFMCIHCAVSLTVHVVERGGGAERRLQCHYCDYRAPLPEQCPTCTTSTSNIKCKGVGTQQMVAVLEKLLPGARIARADADASRRKHEWASTMKAFEEHSLDILVGTQIITKGYHFPKVTLVGVVWADSSLHFPVYNAHEVALQQLIQVAGRAGRASEKSSVIIQSFDDHELFSYVDEQKYMLFCEQELATRKELSYPPFGRLLVFEIFGSNEARVAQDAQIVVQKMRACADPEVSILGPATPLLSKVSRTYYRQIICKAPSLTALYCLVDKMNSFSWVKSTVQVTHG